jgi:C4-dicarboxylate-specific signal transduction histidine kinase
VVREHWRRRRVVWPLAVVGILYLLGPTLSPVERLNDLLVGTARWPAIAVVALLALVVVLFDDRRLRRRLRQAREEQLRVVLK